MLLFASSPYWMRKLCLQERNSSYSHARSRRGWVCTRLWLSTLLISFRGIPADKETQPAHIPSLAAVFANDFVIGTAVSTRMLAQDPETRHLLTWHFRCLTPENEAKWNAVNRKEGHYDFSRLNKIIEFAQQYKLAIIGHVLIWHAQVPSWVFTDQKGKPASRALLLQRMRRHIATMLKHTHGKINAWDVVNEAFLANGRFRQSLWFKRIGPDYIEHAFRAAMEADPDCKLIYNDYGLYKKQKRQAVVKLISRLRAQGIRIDAVGMQMHCSLNHPRVEEIEQSILAFANAGVKVHISELDIDVLPLPRGIWGGMLDKRQYTPALDPYRNGLPEHVATKLAQRYKKLFALFLKHRDKIERLTIWGVTDRYSWKNNFPISGRINYPTLFDRNGTPKDAFYEVIRLKKRP